MVLRLGRPCNGPRPRSGTPSSRSRCAPATAIRSRRAGNRVCGRHAGSSSATRKRARPRAAALLRAFLNALDGQAESGRTAAWQEARLHLLVSSELRAAEG
ncbi:hypothetical protein [Streptomyces sp900116325]|uniref:Uncharacterized protein n=1 Tax=Streptomyces sp. 900116325 TaxID=3154295 RepID=A0ABV2UF07_9ACTN